MMILATCATGLGLGSVSALFPSQAQAATQSDPRTLVVRYHDLDLGSQQGWDRLDQRIHRAAREVCAAESVVAQIKHRAIRECIDSTHATAWAVVQQRNGISAPAADDTE